VSAVRVADSLGSLWVLVSGSTSVVASPQDPLRGWSSGGRGRGGAHDQGVVLAASALAVSSGTVAPSEGRTAVVPGVRVADGLGSLGVLVSGSTSVVGAPQDLLGGGCCGGGRLMHCDRAAFDVLALVLNSKQFLVVDGVRHAILPEVAMVADDVALEAQPGLHHHQVHMTCMASSHQSAE